MLRNVLPVTGDFMESVVAYLLVAVIAAEGKVGVSVNNNVFSNVAECYKYRELTLSNIPEWPAPNLQLICLPVDKDGMGGYIL